MAEEVIFPQQGQLQADALLHAAAARLRFPDAARRDLSVWEEIRLPVRYFGDCPAISSLFPRGTSLANKVFMYKRTSAFEVDNSLNPHNLSASGHMRSHAVPLFPYRVPEFYFWAEVEDRAAFLTLLTSIRDNWFDLRIGQHTRRGYGRIASVNAKRSERLSAVLDEDGQPLRPLPERLGLVKNPDPQKTIRALAVARPPYFAYPAEICWIPAPHLLRPNINTEKSGVSQ